MNMCGHSKQGSQLAGYFERPGDDQNHTAFYSHFIAAQICRHSFMQSVKARLNLCSWLEIHK